MLQDGQILLDGLPHEYPERIGPAHNGTASRNTCSRTLAGRLFGVSTSTSMPSSFLSLKRIAPMSIIAAHGRAEDTHASHAMAQRNLADTRAVLGQGFGWAHGRSVFPPHGWACCPVSRHRRRRCRNIWRSSMRWRGGIRMRRWRRWRIIWIRRGCGRWGWCEPARPADGSGQNAIRDQPCTAHRRSCSSGPQRSRIAASASSMWCVAGSSGPAR